MPELQQAAPSEQQPDDTVKDCGRSINQALWEVCSCDNCVRLRASIYDGASGYYLL